MKAILEVLTANIHLRLSRLTSAYSSSLFADPGDKQMPFLINMLRGERGRSNVIAHSVNLLWHAGRREEKAFILTSFSLFTPAPC